MNILMRFSFVCLLFLVSPAPAEPLSDSLPIEGHYSQAGRPVSRGKVEDFLLTQNSSVEYVDHSLAYKWGGRGVGALLWSVTIGVAVYEFKQIHDAVQNQSILLDTTGKREPFSNRLDKFIIPLTIGSGIASFVQARLYNRSDYLLHKGALAYNASVARKFSKDSVLDLHIEKAGSGKYKQGGLLFAEPVLYGILREQPASAGNATWSWVLRETAHQLGSWGGTYLCLALISYLQERMGGPDFFIDKKAQQLNLTIGISLTAGGIISTIISSAVRNRGIKNYNESLPKPVPYPATPQQGTPSVMPATPSDSSGTGIPAVHKTNPGDTTGTVK
jgi:hypothetical protein